MCPPEPAPRCPPEPAPRCPPEPGPRCPPEPAVPAVSSRAWSAGCRVPEPGPRERDRRQRSWRPSPLRSTRPAGGAARRRLACLGAARGRRAWDGPAWDGPAWDGPVGGVPAPGAPDGPGALVRRSSVSPRRAISSSASSHPATSSRRSEKIPHVTARGCVLVPVVGQDAFVEAGNRQPNGRVLQLGQEAGHGGEIHLGLLSVTVFWAARTASWSDLPDLADPRPGPEEANVPSAGRTGLPGQPFREGR